MQRRLQRNLDARRQNFIGVEEYIWRSSDDDKVRHSHTAYDDSIFRWDTPPPDGHPGQAFGCRCWAEPLNPELTEEELQRIMAQDGIEPVYPELFFIGIGRAAWATAVTAYRGITAISNKLGERLAQYQTERLFRRPEGVPRDWVRKPADKGEGIKYIDPKNVHNEVRIQKGNPGVSNLLQQKDYVKWKRNGQWLDKNGKPVLGKSPEAHIRTEDFRFIRELFR